SEGQSITAATDSARTTASNYAGYNVVTRNAPQIDTNAFNSPDGDVVFGYVSDLGGSASTFQTANPSLYNAVRVRVRKDSSINGEVPFFFGRVFGLTGTGLRAEATAAIVRDAKGFQTPSDGSNLGILPFALDLQTWNGLMAGSGTDSWRWDPTTK